MTAETNHRILGEPIQVRGTREKVSDLVVIHDPSKCTGCMQCMIGCAYKHYRTYDRKFALLYVCEDQDAKGIFVNANCSHCVFPLCLASCPKEAIYKDEKGVVKISPILCVACGTCNQACPIGMPRLDEERKVYVKCDFCDGDYPMCVRMCSPGALQLMKRRDAYEYVEKMKGEKR
ncbi:MAG: 4Fe-4S dicluster domain-containing protein [Candidatus Methanomethylicaceae archaeon]